MVLFVRMLAFYEILIRIRILLLFVHNDEISLKNLLKSWEIPVYQIQIRQVPKLFVLKDPDPKLFFSDPDPPLIYTKLRYMF